MCVEIAPQREIVVAIIKASILSELKLSSVFRFILPMASSAKQWQVQSYTDQRDKVWPQDGRHILAQYDEDSIVVYQAYCPEIAEYAVKHQRL